MKIFEVIQRHFATLGIGPSNRLVQIYRFNKRVLFGILLFGYVIVSQFMYIFCMVNGFMDYVVCICSTSASIFAFVGFAAIVFQKTTLFDCIDNIEKLIDARCKYPKSKAFFMKTNRQVERLSEIVLTLIVKKLLHCCMLPKLIVSFGIYFITDSGNDSFELPFPMWFPFDANNPIGYLIAFTIQYIILGYYHFIAACILALAMGAFWFAIAAIKDFQRFSPIINHKAKGKTSVKQSSELKILFLESINAHGIVKQVVHDFSDIFQPTIMSLFTWSLLAISGALLFIQVEIMDHDNFMHMLVMGFCGIFALALVFIACELGQRMSDAFDEIDFTIDQWDWYLFSIEIKRMLPMIMAIAQQPVELECFGSIICTREVFKNILHSAYSYFMVLRQLND